MMRLRFLVAMTAICVLPLIAVSSVSASEPWWHLSMGARPSLLHAPQDGVQEVTTGEGNFILAKVRIEGTIVACLTSEFIAVNDRPIAESQCGGGEIDDDAAQFEVSLNKHYGAAVVEVAGKAGGAGLVGSGEPMLVRSPGRGLVPIGLEIASGEFASKVVSEGGSGKLLAIAFNVGDAATNGPVTLKDRLPAGLSATGVMGTAELSWQGLVEESFDPDVKCGLAGAREASCTLEGEEGVLQPYERLEMIVWVTGGEVAGAEERNLVSVSGGGARETSISRPVSYGEGPVPFGVEPGSYEQEPEEEGGTADTQAGSHPFQLTTTLRMNETAEEPYQPAQPRNLQFDLPAGVVGDAQATPQCSFAQFATVTEFGGRVANACPANSAVGVSMQEIVVGHQPKTLFLAEAVPMFNLTPAKGEPARFGFVSHRVPVILDTSVRTGSDYGVRARVNNLTEQAATVISSVVSIWGVPGDPRHDLQRGWACLFEGQDPGCSPSLGSTLPLLSMPTACEAFQAPVRVQSWTPEAELLAPVNSGFEEITDGCNKLPFGPEIEAAPDVWAASTPSGLGVHVRVPQEAASNPAGLTSADMRDATVALPAGVTLDPSGAEGLEACSEAQIGFEGKDASDAARDLFTSSLPQPFCPDGSKIATVKITTPLLPNPLEGAVYLASPAPNGEEGQNPFDGLLAQYIVAEDPVSGTLVKIPGQVVPCERAGQEVGGVSCAAAGQLIATFEETPQVPFEDFELHFFGGPNAPLATPALCGSYTTQAVFTPWSGGAPVHSTSTFQITSGPDGGACPSSSLPFSPGFVAEMANVQAGGFSELRTTVGHPDGDQPLGAVSVKTPPGLSAVLSHVKLCGEPQASEGTCGSGSLIGHTVVTAGLGSSPVVIKRPGRVYLTGPFDGRGACTVGEPGCAPFGLSVASPAEAGPFDLEKGTACDCVVVRAKVEVDPRTAQLKIVSGPLPTMIKGIPLDLQHVQIAIDRPGFTFNPTSCDRMRIEGTVGGSEGASAPVSSPFQVADCGALGFKPSFKVSTSARTSKRRGGSLRVRIAFPKNSLGRQANIREVKVQLPKRLPSRTETLRKACPVGVFDRNPAGCPSGSRVGYAKAITPVLPVPLTGPAYFVSYGGAKFPELVVVLQGYGITIALHGETFINERTNVTTSTFKTVPDQPIDSFELTLPEGRHSVLAANGNLCFKTTMRGRHRVRRRVQLVMPTTIVAQDGSVIEQNTKIAVDGCKGARPRGKARHRHHRRRG